VHNNTDSDGATFIVRFPVRSERALMEPRRSFANMSYLQPKLRQDHFPAVLLIEDEPAVMAYVRATLERSGYTVSAPNPA